MHKIWKTWATVAAATLALAACTQQASEEPAPQDDPAQAQQPQSTDEPSLEPTEDDVQAAASSAPAASDSALDYAALQDRGDPERLLRFYVAAIRAGNWNAAASAWSSDAEMSANKLMTRFNGIPTVLAIGKADTASAGGTAFYIVPVTAQRDAGAATQKGTLVLRRSDDAPGSSEEQLNWRIERSTINVGPS